MPALLLEHYELDELIFATGRAGLLAFDDDACFSRQQATTIEPLSLP